MDRKRSLEQELQEKALLLRRRSARCYKLSDRFEKSSAANCAAATLRAALEVSGGFEFQVENTRIVANSYYGALHGYMHEVIGAEMNKNNCWEQSSLVLCRLFQCLRLYQMRERPEIRRLHGADSRSKKQKYKKT